jgi:2-amino-4-hydroxy-6-hydroxymethyldihydropteridine diphosphokinase
VQLQTSSRFYETVPVGGPLGQGAFLNAAALVETDLPARTLLERLLAIENELGRTREVHWGPRTIDLDLLLYGEAIIDEPGLQIPHPRMHERAYVLEPASEIAGAMVHPRLGRTVSELTIEAARRKPSG